MDKRDADGINGAFADGRKREDAQAQRIRHLENTVKTQQGQLSELQQQVGRLAAKVMR